jgi:hypothetical protein
MGSFPVLARLRGRGVSFLEVAGRAVAAPALCAQNMPSRAARGNDFGAAGMHEPVNKRLQGGRRWPKL